MAAPEQILKQLTDLWSGLGRAPGAAEPGVLRACAMTLIVAVRHTSEMPPVKEALAEIMRAHPSRAILVCLRPEEEPLAAHVSAECWLPFGRRQQICCEQIEITAGASRYRDLPPLLLALTAPDLPVVLWCRHALLLELPEMRPIAGLAGKMVYDSADHPRPFELLEKLADSRRPPVFADLAWTRLTRWREAVAHSFDQPANCAQLAGLSEVAVSWSGETLPVSAVYLGAWIAASLGWSSSDPRMRFERASGAVPGAEQGPADLLGLALRGPHFEIALKRAEISEPGLAALLSEELAISGPDPVYDSVVRLAVRMAAANTGSGGPTRG